VSLLDFFLSFRGRISRQSWWLGIIVLVAVSTPIGLVLDPDAFKPDSDGQVKPPTLALTLWNLLTCLPTAAITAKRLNDRDWPSWTGYLLALLLVALSLANHFGLLLDPVVMTPVEGIVFAAIMLFFIWVLIESGFLKGSDGPNRYGPDPLPSKPDHP